MGNNPGTAHGFDPDHPPPDTVEWEKEHNQDTKVSTYTPIILSMCMAGKAANKAVMTSEAATTKWHKMDADAQRSILGMTYNEYLDYFVDDVAKLGDMVSNEGPPLMHGPDVSPPEDIEYLPLPSWDALVAPYFKDRYQRMKNELESRLNTLKALDVFYEIGKGTEDLVGGAFNLASFLSKYGIYIAIGGGVLFAYSALKK